MYPSKTLLAVTVRKTENWQEGETRVVLLDYDFVEVLKRYLEKAANLSRDGLTEASSDGLTRWLAIRKLFPAKESLWKEEFESPKIALVEFPLLLPTPLPPEIDYAHVNIFHDGTAEFVILTPEEEHYRSWRLGLQDIERVQGVYKKRADGVAA